MSRLLWRAFFSIIALAHVTLMAKAAEPYPADAKPEQGDQVRLVVVIAVDQLRPDRLSPEMPGGLGRLLREGHVFSAATIDHAVTNTCPGHAVILTGMNPSGHGIIGNEYFDRDSWMARYCVADEAAEARVFGADHGRSPRAMRATTLGDWLKASDVQARTISLSMKDRAAITLGGQQADAVFWFDEDAGRMTTSRYFLEDINAAPEWIREFNGESPLVDGYLSTLPAQWVHPEGEHRADDFHAEDDEFSRTSPHPLGSGDSADIPEQFYASPWADRAIGELARRAIEHERLGQGQATDLLALSFSAVDSIGHRYGPFSAEADDALRTLDQTLGLLFDELDARFEPGETLVVLTSDHGVAPLPEWSGAPAAERCEWEEGRATILPLVLSMYARIYWEFTFPIGNPFDLVAFSGPQIYVSREQATALDVPHASVVAWLESYLERQPFIEEAWRPEEFMESSDPDATLYRHSYDPARSGDLVIENASGCLIGGEYGTTHGSPHGYDRNIPLIFMGADIAPAIDPAEAHSVDIAPTLARLLGIDAPAGLDGKSLIVP